jgi:HSP20 family protein
MLAHFSDFDRTIATMDALRRRMDQVFHAGTDGGPLARAAAFPRTHLTDRGDTLVLSAELPGFSEDDVEITLDKDVLTIAGARRVTAPEGYSVHRQERPASRFSRSVALPTPVDPENVAATLSHGVLTVTLEKAREAQPRTIAVRSR